MASVRVLALLAAFPLGSIAADCEGVVFLNETLMQFGFGRRMSEVLPVDCHIPIEVDSSHCGYEYTPEYRVVGDDSDFYNCSFIVNPRATRFELFCTFSEEYFAFQYVFPDIAAQISADEGQPGTVGSGSDRSRRLSQFITFNPLPEDVVIRWVAKPARYLDECNDTIVNLTRQIEDLEDIIENLRTTETTTRTSETTATQTTATQTTTTPVGATSTGTFLAPTRTVTTTTSALVDVVQAGATSDCESLLLLLILSVALNALLIMIIIFLLLRLRKRRDYRSQVDVSTSGGIIDFDLDGGVSRPSSAAPSSDRERAVRGVAPASSAGTESVGSVGGSEAVRGPHDGSGQDGGDSWAGRSIIYRYLRVGTRSGNEIKADFRRGPVMRATEAPQMDAASAASGSVHATPTQSATSSGGIRRSQNEPGQSSAGRSLVPEPPSSDADAVA